MDAILPDTGLAIFLECFFEGSIERRAIGTVLLAKCDDGELACEYRTHAVADEIDGFVSPAGSRRSLLDEVVDLPNDSGNDVGCILRAQPAPEAGEWQFRCKNVGVGIGVPDRVPDRQHFFRAAA